jgi:hypothetical protein
MIEETGELRIADANDANVPVDIWLRSPGKWKLEGCFDYDGEQDTSNLWLLTANNYMPRKARLGNPVKWCYEVWGTEAELRELVKKHVLPLYVAAVEVLQGIADGKENHDHLYYWELPKEE